MNATKQQARLGLFYLKESVVNVLFEAQDEIRLDEIRVSLGIPRVDEEEDRVNTLIRGILYHLKNEGRVEHIENKWKITDDEAVLMGGESPEVRNAPFF